MRNTSREGKSGYVPKKCSLGVYLMAWWWVMWWQPCGLPHLKHHRCWRSRRYLQSRALGWLRYGISARENITDVKLCSTGKIKVRKQREPNQRMTKELRLTLLKEIAQSCCCFLRIHSWGTFWWNVPCCTSVPRCDPDSFLQYLFFFQLETFCKEAFGNVSACRHYETQKKEWKKEREGRPWHRRYTKVWTGVGSALVTICGVVFWLYNGFWVKSNTKHQMGNCRFKVANTASIGVWWKIRAAPLGRMVDAEVALNRAV